MDVQPRAGGKFWVVGPRGFCCWGSLSSPFLQCRTVFVPQTDIWRYIFCDVSTAMLLCLLSANFLFVQRVLKFLANLERQKCTFCVATLELTRRALFVCNWFAPSDGICNVFTKLYPPGVAKTRIGSGCIFRFVSYRFFCKPGLANPKK